MKTEQFVALYSNKEGKKVIKLLQGTSFSIRKFMKLTKEQYKYASRLFQDRIANKFCNLKQKFEYSISTTPEGVLTASCPFFEHRSLLEYIDKASNIKSFSPIMQQLILIMLRGQNQYFYSYDNLLCNPFTHEIIFAPFSLAGLLPLRFKTQIPKQEFIEIYELLDKDLLSSGAFHITYKTKFKALGIILIQMILRKRISLILEGDITSDYVSFDQAELLVQKLNKRMCQLLLVQMAKTLIKQASDRDKVDYYFFLKRVFYDDCEGMTWREVKDCLIPRRAAAPSQLEASLNKIVSRIYQQEPPYAKNRLQQLGILSSDPEIYLVYKMQIPRLNFEKTSDLIMREKYISSDNINLFNNFIKLSLFIQSSSTDTKSTLGSDFKNNSNSNTDKNVKIIFGKQDEEMQEYREMISKNHSKPDKQISEEQASEQQQLIRDKSIQKQQKEGDSDQTSDIEKQKKQSQKYDMETCQNHHKKTQRPISIITKPSKQIIENQGYDCINEDSFVFQSNSNNKTIQNEDDELKQLKKQSLKIIENMVNNFKTNVSEIKGTKIYALDPRMAMINRYLKL